MKLAEEQLKSEKLLHESYKRKAEEARRESFTMSEMKSPAGDAPLLLNFDDLQTNLTFVEESSEGVGKKKCLDCPEKDIQIETLKKLNANYEKISKDSQATVSSLQERIYKMNEQLQASQEDQNRLSLNTNRSQLLTNSTLMAVSSKRNIGMKESGFAQELLQKNLSREEENKRLKLKISKLNQELYENQKTYAQRIELIYSLLEAYRN